MLDADWIPDTTAGNETLAAFAAAKAMEAGEADGANIRAESSSFKLLVGFMYDTLLGANLFAN